MLQLAELQARHGAASAKRQRDEEVAFAKTMAGQLGGPRAAGVEGAAASAERPTQLWPSAGDDRWWATATAQDLAQQAAWAC